MTPRTEAGRALLAELRESPLPGARYARDVVALRLPVIEAEMLALVRERLNQAQAFESCGGYGCSDERIADYAVVLAMLDELEATK